MASNESRAPLLQVTLNGAPLPGVIDAEVSNTSHLGADRFRASAALSVTSYAPWAAASLQLEISAGLDGASISLITGLVDQLECDLGRGVVTFSGRDLSARLMSSRTAQSYDNQTSSQIASQIAGAQGLTPNIAATTALVGRDYGNGHVRLTLDQHAGLSTDWDLLTRLAEQENFELWVSGQTLNFQPLDQAAPLLQLGPQDCSALELRRTPVLQTGLAVAVKSWDCRGQQAIVQMAGAGAGAPNYIVLKPNLPAATAQAMAQRLQAGMAQQARTICLEMPGELAAMPRGLLALSNTGTDFDGTYLITDVERRLCFSHGFTQTLQARLPPWIASSTS